MAGVEAHHHGDGAGHHTVPQVGGGGMMMLLVSVLLTVVLLMLSMLDTSLTSTFVTQMLSTLVMLTQGLDPEQHPTLKYEES